jgi:hypothetical protein
MNIESRQCAALAEQRQQHEQVMELLRGIASELARQGRVLADQGKAQADLEQTVADLAEAIWSG